MVMILIFSGCLGETEKDKKVIREKPTRSNYYHKLQFIVKSSYNNYKVIK